MRTPMSIKWLKPDHSAIRGERETHAMVSQVRVYIPGAWIVTKLARLTAAVGAADVKWSGEGSRVMRVT